MLRSVFLLMLVACGAREIPGPQAKMRLDGGFFDAPFPIATRAKDRGALRIDDFPNPKNNTTVATLLDGLGSPGGGFGLNAAVFVPFDSALDPESLNADNVLLLDLDEPDHVVPVRFAFKAAAETYSPENVLVVLPEPGYPLEPARRHALVVLDSVRSADGRVLGSPLVIEQLKRGAVPQGGAALAPLFSRLVAVLKQKGIDPASVRAATAWVTGDPFAETLGAARFLEAEPAPVASHLRVLRDTYAYCAVEGTITLPIFQAGTRPFAQTGGGISVDGGGVPAQEASEAVRFAVSIPKIGASIDHAMPLVLYMPGQGGIYTQFLDRGKQSEAMNAGLGPALYLAHSGIAMASIDSLLAGPRHPTGSIAGADFFNAVNPIAFRDNTRQSAFDFVMLRKALEVLEVPPGLCGDTAQRFDPEALFGHSTGATYAAIVLGAMSGFSSGVLSGVGGSWLYNLTLKSEPIEFKPVVGFLLGYQEGDEADIFDPVLNLAQTLWEPIEPMNWSAHWARFPFPDVGARATLLIGGDNDGYFPEPSQEALRLSSGAVRVDLGKSYTLSAPSNVWIQHQTPEGITGHYAPFDTPDATYRLRCFLASALLSDRPYVARGGGSSALNPCAP